MVGSCPSSRSRTPPIESIGWPAGAFPGPKRLRRANTTRTSAVAKNEPSTAPTPEKNKQQTATQLPASSSREPAPQTQNSQSSQHALQDAAQNSMRIPNSAERANAVTLWIRPFLTLVASGAKAELASAAEHIADARARQLANRIAARKRLVENEDQLAVVVMREKLKKAEKNRIQAMDNFFDYRERRSEHPGSNQNNPETEAPDPLQTTVTKATYARQQRKAAQGTAEALRGKAARDNETGANKRSVARARAVNLNRGSRTLFVVRKPACAPTASTSKTV